ncbi:hypothetical protein Poli38472_008500 [Pythium oligandrum]|uniref:Uncharacterized protein n=1 Tax=Pythium oligandrum TaxID=41045 RepID=A0A8K1C3M6_PYTOL|nr:hypothetical protein Poli38472_008500 [Pythium oligandrum]|eukprot:TMW55852.1 hypothetical protein Poli38472_008500 [Pythium oligandrum]
MSLGFLTESALLPSKAKEIKVDSKSLLDLKAVVYKKEQERRERQRRLKEALHQEEEEAPGRGKYARLKAKKRKGSDEDRLGGTANRGVDKRRKRDESEKELDVDDDADDAALQRKSREMLEKKARLYEAMMQGKTMEDREGNGMSAAAMAESLVDFDEKKRSGMAMKESALWSRSKNDMVEIADEFGRSRLVEKGSKEYEEYMRTQQTPPRINQLDENRGHDDQPAGGSFVASQWEKTLHSTEKAYLQQVHEGVEQAKRSTVAMDKQTRKQLRLQKLRQQQQQQNVALQPDNSSTENAAAAAQATEFLNQFTSMM